MPFQEIKVLFINNFQYFQRGDFRVQRRCTRMIKYQQNLYNFYKEGLFLEDGSIVKRYVLLVFYDDNILEKFQELYCFFSR